MSDEDEANAAQCVNGATQPCDVGACSFAGIRTCANTIWSQCVGTCDAGVDAGVDAGTGCDPNGTFYLDAGVISYSCCEFAGTPLVNIDVSRFQIQSAGTVLRPLPTQSGNTMTTSAAPTCPTGSFTYSRVMPGNCTEAYTLVGSFVGPNTFVGTYSASYTGTDCAAGLCANSPCSSRSWNISAGR